MFPRPGLKGLAPFALETPMTFKKLLTSLSLSLVLLFGAVSHAAPLVSLTDWQAQTCQRSLLPAAPTATERRLEDIKTLKVMTYNIENLFMHVGQGPNPQQQVKPMRKRREAAQAILRESPDIIVMQEVEKDLSTAEEYANIDLQGQYRALMVAGNDERGINIAFFVKNDLPFEAVLQTHRDERAVDPVNPRAGPVPIFSRDVPELSLFARGMPLTGVPLFSILGVHFKSKRDRPGDAQGRMLRGAQAQRTVDLVNRLRRQWGERSRVIVTGDFNGKMRTDRELDPLASIGMTDALDAARVPRTVEDRTTHTFHPSRSRTDYSRLDYMLLSPAVAQSVVSAHVHRYIDPATGQPRPLPASRGERNKNPSDHFPVIMEIDLQP
jgi:endonuclease/exonuclease/phosphatase family metal-dependent hydrolase